MEAFRYELEKRTIFERLQLRLLARFARRRSDKILCFRWNSIIHECFRDLIEQPLIDRAAQWHEVCTLYASRGLRKNSPISPSIFPGPEALLTRKILRPV